MSVDFLIFTALLKEWIPLKEIFKPKRIKKIEKDINQYYQVTINNKMTSNYTVILFNAGEKGQIISARLTNANTRWNPKYIILVGIAATIPGAEQKLGHILIADTVVNIPEIVMRPKSKEYRGRAVPCSDELINEIEDYISSFKKKQKSKYHVGPIIAQPNLIRSAKDRDIYVKEALKIHKTKPIGLEMEGGGVSGSLEAFPYHMRAGFIVIKGAVDYANPRKKDDHQRKAALNVAMFVKGFLKYGPVSAKSTKSKISSGKAVKIFTQQIKQKDKVIISTDYPYNRTADNYKILLRKLVIKYQNGDTQKTSGDGLGSYIDSIIGTINRIFSPSPNLLSSNQESVRENVLAIHDGDDKGEPLCPNFKLTGKIIKIDSTHDFRMYWNSEEGCNDQGGNIFEFVLTELQINNPQENNHGALYLNEDNVPGRHALFSLSEDVSSPKSANKEIIKYYKNIRLCIFLLRNLIRSFGGIKFHKLHTNQTGPRYCLMYDPGSDCKDTYTWIMKNLNFKLCPACKDVLESSIKNYTQYSNIRSSISNASAALCIMRSSVPLISI